MPRRPPGRRSVLCAFLAILVVVGGAVWAVDPSCDPDLPFRRLASPSDTLGCIERLRDQTEDPLGRAFWQWLYAAKQAVQARDDAAIAGVRRSMADFAKEHGRTVYGARALMHAADLTRTELNVPIEAVPLYRQARELFKAHPQWPPLDEFLAYIDEQEGDCFLMLRAHELTLRYWEGVLRQYPATRAAQSLPARLRSIYARWEHPPAAFEKTLKAYDAVLEHVDDAEVRGRLVFERLDVIEEGVRAGLVPPQVLLEAARAALDAFPPGESAYIDVGRERLEVLAGVDGDEASEPGP